MVHETLHAFLLEATKERDLNSNIFDLLNKYNTKYPKVLGDTHHSLMSQYILGMSVSLYNWDKKFGPTGGNLGFEYYYKMVFGGLIKDGTSDLIEEAKPFIPSGSSWQEIKSIIENEATGNYKANGEKCN